MGSARLSLYALAYALLMSAVFPFTVHADIVQPIADTETTDPFTYESGWTQSLGTGMSGTTTEVSFRIHWQATSPFANDRMGLDLKTCSNPEYSQCSGSRSVNFPFATTSGQTTIRFNSQTLGFPFSFNFKPEKYYQMSVYRLYSPNFKKDRVFKVVGSAEDTYEHGSTAAGGLSDLAFSILGVSREATTTPEATSTPSGPSSVLFLPGFEASRLYEGEDTRLWEPLGLATPVENLALDTGGASVRNDIYAKEVMDEAYGTVNIYKSFLDKMAALKGEGGIADFEAVPYDWRLSLEDNVNYGKEVGDKIYYSGDNRGTSTPYLAQELRRLAAASPAHKVSVVAHSNGGLLLKQLLLTHPELNALIDKIVFVDVPQVGTPQALAALLHGNKQGIPSDWAPLLFSQEDARALANNFPSAYNLLPTQGYFTYVDDPVATFDPETLPDYVTRYGDVIHSTERLDSFLDDSYDKVAPESSDLGHAATSNAVMRERAQLLHSALDAWEPASTTELIQIAGWGVPTLKAIEYAKETKCPVLTFIGCAKTESFTYMASTTIDGDGTVVTPSQLWTSANLPNVKNYWVDLHAHNRAHIVSNLGGLLATDHKSVLEVPSLLGFLSDNISSTTPTSDVYEYLTSSAPQKENESRLRYSLHSPLTLNLYDSQGRHTGISTTTGEIVEGIPGTYYMEFGDAKYVFTETIEPMQVVMNGYATSTFTLKVDQLAGDTVTASSTFKDIPVTPATTASISTDFDIATLSPLTIDLGDGVERSVEPVENGVATLDLTPPEIQFGFSTSTKALQITSMDDSGSSTLTSTTTYNKGQPMTTVVATDHSGNTTELVYTPDYSENNKVSAILVSLSYNGQKTMLQNTSLSYNWALPPDGRYRTFHSSIINGTTSTMTQYFPFRNLTTLSKKMSSSSRPTITNVPGFVVPYLITGKGQLLSKY